jgi:hypothetical protein
MPRVSYQIHHDRVHFGGRIIAGTYDDRAAEKISCLIYSIPVAYAKCFTASMNPLLECPNIECVEFVPVSESSERAGKEKSKKRERKC